MVVDHICVNYGARLFQELFLALNNSGVEQNIFYPRNEKHHIADSDKPYRIDSPMILNLHTKVSFLKKRRVLQQQYDPLFQRNKPDLIHAHTLFSDGSLAYYYNKNFKTPYVVAIRSTDIDVFLKFKPWLRRYAKQILDHAGNIIFISPSLQKKFHQIFGSIYDSKSLVIPNGINQAYLNSGELNKKEPHTPLELLYVGSFLKRKKVPALIKLIENSDTRLTIVGGGGNEEKKVLKMIQDSNKIKYLGLIEDQSRLTQIYRKYDIFIMTSTAETFGLVYLEAMSQGLPVIYSTNTGIDGLFKQGSIGYGVGPGSIPEMKKVIDKILANYEVISKNCVAEAKNLNWGNIADQYHELYAKI